MVQQAKEIHITSSNRGCKAKNTPEITKLKNFLKHSYQEDIKKAKNDTYTFYLKTNSFKPIGIWKIVNRLYGK